mgnify:FL=1
MYNLIRVFNQNRKKIITVILIIVFIIAVIQILNFISKQQKTQGLENIIIKNANYGDEVVSSKSPVTGKSVSEDELKSTSDVIKQFMEYCNNSNVESAYSLLTNECKEEMYPTLNDFNNIYFKYTFGGEKKTYTIENWIDNVYQVRITGDILSTGKIDNATTKQDYITIVEENNELKLNINKYVGRSNPDKVTEIDNIKFTITQVDTYMDYKEYNLLIENNSSNDILLDTSNDTKSIYLIDRNDKKTYFLSSEITPNQFVVQSKYKTNLKIKFAYEFASNNSLKNIVFSKSILNYDEYRKLDNKEQFNDFQELKIKI